MAADGFDKWLAVAWAPNNDGQPFHRTPGDAGGATAWGVTFGTFLAWRNAHGGPSPVVADLQNASKDELSLILRTWFWNAIQGDALPVGVDLVTAEACMMSGQGTAARILQGVVGATTDGVIGPHTVAAVVAMDPAAVVAAFAAAYVTHVNALSSAPLFAGGWDRRIAEDAATAQAWLQAAGDQAALVSSAGGADALNAAELAALPSS